MRMENRLVLILVLGLGTKSFAQTSGEYIGLQYSLYPSGEEYTTISRSKLYAGFTNRFKNLSFEHALGFEVDQLDFPIEYSTNDNNTSRIYDFSYAVNLNYEISEFLELHLELEPTLTSDLKNSLSSKDLFLYGGAFALLRGEVDAKPFYFKLGVAYSRYLGEPEFLPVLSFSSRLSERLYFKLGFPESKITYKLGPSGSLSAGLEYEGKYANLSSPLYLEDNDPANKLKWEWSSINMNYSYELNKFWSFDFGIGYLLKNNFSLRNENEKTISTFKLDSSPFLSSGIKLMFN